jgi:5-methyltetrahydrofolate--homocysteine methyltransferase
LTPLLLDGAMGTALLDAGLPPGALPERWLLERPDAVAAVHASHAAAGARVLLTSTFNLAAPRLREAGIEAGIDVLARRAVQLAREAAPARRVAGATGPTLLGGVGRAELVERHAAAFRALAAAGADLLWTESGWDLEESRAAVTAALATGKPVVATIGVQMDGAVLRCGSGEPAVEALAALASDGAMAVGVNCALPGIPLEALFGEAAARLAVPLVAKPSAGLPGQIIPPPRFAAWLRELARAGASWLGGCCGATAAHLAAGAEALEVLET